MSARVMIVDYDSRWPILYQEERRRILDAIGHAAVAIEHVGSTAVPRLGGKPIIEHPNIALKLFDAYQIIEAARALIWKVSWKNGRQFPGDIPLTAAARCFTTNKTEHVYPGNCI